MKSGTNGTVILPLKTANCDTDVISCKNFPKIITLLSIYGWLKCALPGGKLRAEGLGAARAAAGRGLSEVAEAPRSELAQVQERHRRVGSQRVCHCGRAPVQPPNKGFINS